jgi:hypothetical protein
MKTMNDIPEGALVKLMRFTGRYTVLTTVTDCKHHIIDTDGEYHSEYDSYVDAIIACNNLNYKGVIL